MTSRLSRFLFLLLLAMLAAVASADMLHPAAVDPPGRTAVYRFYNATNGAHFYTQSAAERDAIVASLPQFRFEGTAFYAYTQAGEGLSPVFRFFNTASNAHFYTISTGERDAVIANFKQFRYEGPVWFARTAPGEGATALYRFFRNSNSAHFFTPSASERDSIVANLPDFRYEGTAYYVWSGAAASVDDALDELNRIRTAAGVNPLALNAQVDQAAGAHALYLVTSATATEDAHGERAGAANFTGVDLRARLATAGYANPTAWGEVLATASLGSKSADPTRLVRSLMNAPYHGLSMLAGYRDAGVGFESGYRTVLVVDLAAANGGYLSIPDQDVRMSPCNGIDNMLNQTIADESPAPIPGRNIGTDPIGTPLYVMVREGATLTLSSYEIRNLQTNETVPVVKVLGDSAADNVAASKRAILPNRPLAVDTSYRATVSGLNNGAAFTKVCDFRTGS